VIISQRILLRMRNVSDKSTMENETKHFVFNNIFFLENCTVYKIKWKNIVQSGSRQMTIRRMRIACWVTKATDTHSEYVILSAFLLKHWLHEHGSVSHYSLRAKTRL